MSNTVEVEFTNDIGQVIKPGDEVVIVTTGYSHSVSTNKGIYLGRYGSEKGGVQCIKKVKTNYWIFKNTKERVPNSFWDESYKEKSKWIAEWRANGGNYWGYGSQPEYQAINDKYMNQVELASEYVDRRTTLQLNRIYKLAA